MSLWLAYIAARKGTGGHIPTDSAPVSRGWWGLCPLAPWGRFGPWVSPGAHRVPLFQDGPVEDVDALATVSWCLRKVKMRQENARRGWGEPGLYIQGIFFLRTEPVPRVEMQPLVQPQPACSFTPFAG